MPVVIVSLRRLAALAGAPEGAVRERLPFLGLDIEHESGDEISVEYSPNRFDYSTEFGIATGLQGVLGTRTGLPDVPVGPARHRIDVSEGVAPVRPAITGILAYGCDMDDYMIRQLISMQEDLHQGPGRRRRRLAIGMHDADKIAFPLEYTVAGMDFEFAPLGSDDEMSVARILEGTPQGVQYGGLVSQHGAVPLLADSRGRVASLPPIINSNHTVVTESTKNLFVDITGGERADVEDALAIMAAALHASGCRLEHLDIRGGNNRTPPMSPRQMSLDCALSNRVLGLCLDSEGTARCLRQARLGARADGDTVRCTIPPHRPDIFGPMDLVEEVALGYGIDRMGPTVPDIGEPGRTGSGRSLDMVMIGLGCTQVMNPCLCGEDALSRAGYAPEISVADPKSRSHTALRPALLPGLIECLSQNIHEPYPHRLYEAGAVFEVGPSGTIRERFALACVMAHKDATYSEAKSVLSAALYHAGIRARTPPQDAPPFEEGRAADIQDGSGRSMGRIGEVSESCRRAFRIREGVRAAGWEVNLILDGIQGMAAP